MRSKDEELLQINCITWFDYQYPQLKKLLFAVPNGGKRHIVTATNLKKQGVRAGVSDLVLLYPCTDYPFMCLELKTPKGTQEDSQKEFQKSVESVGGLYVLIRTFDEFKDIIVRYMTLGKIISK